MAYTERRKVNQIIKYYRVVACRKLGKVIHTKEYLGSNLSKNDLRAKEVDADRRLVISLNSLLSDKEHRELNKIKKDHRAKHPSTLRNRYETFIAEFTYDSTGIEGNTLTLQETAAVLFEGTSPNERSLREVHEVLNHKKAFDTLLNTKRDLDKNIICAIQKIVTENTLRPELREQAGKYRTVPVFIRGSTIIPPPPKSVQKDMRSLMGWYAKNRDRLHSVIVAAYFHAAFEAIHPFVDGNGRTGRLLLNFMLQKANYPMVSIPRTERSKYFRTLANAQNGNLRPFLQFIIALLRKSDKSI